MKTYIYRLFAFLPALLLGLACTSCGDDTGLDRGEESASNCFNLTVKVPMEDFMRATPVELNEFKVRSIHFYFYKSDGHDDATKQSVYDCVIDEEFDTRRTLRVELPDDALRAGGLFGTDDTQCIVYAVANADKTLFPEGTAKTIDELKATTIGSAFDITKVQDAFAMDGKAVVSLDRTNRIATGEIELRRAAAKLTLSVDLPSSITVTGTVINNDGTVSEGETREYHSRPELMHVWIDNGVKQSLLNTPPVRAAEADLYSNDISTAAGVGSAFTFVDAMEKYKYVQDVPFYSYPNKWEATNPNGSTCLTLRVPWWYTDKDGNTQTVETYYRLGVQTKNCYIERNMHYDLRVTVGRLGGTTVQEPTDMEVDWNYALPWNKQTLETDIKEIRYLMLNNNYYDPSVGAYVFRMDNSTDISVTLGTSHKVEIESVTLKWRDYYNNNSYEVADRSISLTTNGDYKYSSIKDYNPANIFAGIEVDNVQYTLSLRRAMLHLLWSDEKATKATISSTPAFCTYTFEIKLRHIDDHSRTATVHITQFPAIYITAEESPLGTLFVNNNNDTIDYEENGVRVKKAYSRTDNTARPDNYGVKPEDTNWDYYMGSREPGKNHNTYIINISKFDSASVENYIIADPRVREVDNLPARDVSDPKNWPAHWSVRDDSRNYLRYYYPTDGSSLKQRFIAPKYRIGSQLGSTRTMTFEGAKRRCASYQENGRYAGRWRLPTVAEIEFVARLSNRKNIPYLFGQSGTTPSYWCAYGLANVNNDTINPPSVTISARPVATSVAYVRCVYDDWYWGDDVTAIDKFAWGDRPRTNSGN